MPARQHTFVCETKRLGAQVKAVALPVDNNFRWPGVNLCQNQGHRWYFSYSKPVSCSQASHAAIEHQAWWNARNYREGQLGQGSQRVWKY